jgi:hypothetical protein
MSTNHDGYEQAMVDVLSILDTAKTLGVELEIICMAIAMLRNSNLKNAQESAQKTMMEAVKKPRKGSIAYDCARLAPIWGSVGFLCETAVSSGATLKEVLSLVKAGYKGAEKQRGAEKRRATR